MGFEKLERSHQCQLLLAARLSACGLHCCSSDSHSCTLGLHNPEGEFQQNIALPTPSYQSHLCLLLAFLMHTIGYSICLYLCISRLLPHTFMYINKDRQPISSSHPFSPALFYVCACIHPTLAHAAYPFTSSCPHYTYNYTNPVPPLPHTFTYLTCRASQSGSR